MSIKKKQRRQIRRESQGISTPDSSPKLTEYIQTIFGENKPSENHTDNGLWHKIVSFKPRLPIYIFIGILIFELILEFYTLKYVDYDEAMFATRVMQIVETPWPVKYNIIHWPMRGWLIREELLFFVSAIAAKLFGLSYTAMKIPILFFRMTMLTLVFIFCYKFFSYEAAVLSALFTAFGLQMSQRSICGQDYTSTPLFIILLTYLFFSKILKDENQNIIYFFIFGIIAGISLDIYRAVFTFLFAIGLFLIYKKKTQIFSRECLVLGSGFIIGSIPMIKLVADGNPFVAAPQGNPVSPFDLSGWWLHLKTFPPKFMSLFNFFNFFGDNNSFYAYLISFIFAIAIPLLYLFTLKEIWVYFRQSKGLKAKDVRIEILLFIDVYLPLYLFSFIYINDINTPLRYMAFVYPLIGVLAGISLMMVINKYKLKRAFNIITVLFIGIGIFSHLLLIRPSNELVDEQYQRAEDFRVKTEEVYKVIQFLKVKGLDHVFCNQLRWPIIFLSRGAIQASSTFFFMSPNYGVSLDQRFFETINVKNLCFVYYDTASDSTRDSIFKFFKDKLHVNYKIEKVGRYEIAYSDGHA